MRIAMKREVKTEQTLQYLIAEADANDMNKNNKYQKLKLYLWLRFLKTELLYMADRIVETVKATAKRNNE